MSLQLGRLTGITAHKSVQLGGASGVRIGGSDAASSLAEARARVQQILGLSGSVQPLVSGEEPHLDGFYRFSDVSAEAEPGLWDQRYLYRWDARIERVPHYQAAGFNLRSNQPERLNSPGGVTHAPWVGLPSTLKMFDVGSDSSVTYYETRVGPGGTARYYESSSAFDNDTGRGVIDPANWYDMSPKIQVGGYTVTGSQIPSLANVATPNWQLDNGLVKFEDTSTSDKLFKMSLPDTSGTPGNWGTAYEVEVGYYDGTTWRPQTNLVGLQAMRNDAQECGIVLLLRVKSPVNNVAWESKVTLRLRRGGLFAECHISGGRAQKYGVKLTALAGAATAYASNEGCYKTSSDANGNKPVIISSETLTTSGSPLADGWAYLASSARRCILGLGGSISGSAPNQTTDLRDQFMAAGGVTINVGA